METLSNAGSLNLLGHDMARLVGEWLFADAYAVTELQSLASSALFEALAFTQASVVDLVDLFELIYATTKGPETDSNRTGSRPLRHSDE